MIRIKAAKLTISVEGAGKGTCEERLINTAIILFDIFGNDMYVCVQ